ncbi:MAG: ABC transporter ATP-binding protein [Candidatus Krumholzibacteria bacterium]|nr:ABC transporter ATP-binding protein [Candidatus Krumholzibacteria bacterium]
MEREKILEARGIWRVFEGTKGPIEVLKGLDLAVTAGEVVAIIGASGAGKSTLLHILGTLDWPDRGTVQIRGVDPRECSSPELDSLRNRDLGFVFQFHYLLPEFTALENVMMPAVIGGRDRREAEKRSLHLLGEVGLAERVHHRPAELSGGEQQRVAVARALVNEPSIVLADEPSGNLDDQASESLHGLVRTLSRSKGQTFIIVTHKRELLDEADRGFVLAEGCLHPIGKGSDALPVL